MFTNEQKKRIENETLCVVLYVINYKGLSPLGDVMGLIWIIIGDHWQMPHDKERKTNLACPLFVGGDDI